ncbi:TVP38/TMEM64 family protein [Thermocoleostomius sinensis]|jgi:uncharacterized membrane protein YdjX (TVP38/TMEM64 family)|uniref:TVP38/TMEM64 family membrane protein n=1 Tax=Thermocoleostomius sinensis A174 TaxID=2016057 RepID=A0A9E8ZJC8_9CYAN|nr:VTT domain-containing protein [Thermocoleostomius sinensis]WAL59561.1 VTT domain-containing protein [Thermocoleostomius sinensis A174]
MRIGKYKKLLTALLFAVVLYVGLALALQAIGLDNAQAFIEQTGWWAPAIFILLCAVSLILAPLSGSSLFVVGGALFGKELAWLLSWTASIVGCSINFWISRTFGRRVVSRFVGEGNLDELDRFTQQLRGHRDILGMLVIMPLSQDIVSYAVGLTRIPFARFLIALIISAAAIVAAYIYLGTSILEALIQGGE